jgi:predicted RNase H-like HicB family nuclease
MVKRAMKTSEHRYEIILYWSNKDEAYIAEVPELQWCAADGETYQEALENVEVIIDEWIETAKEKGWTIPEPKGRRLMYA